MYEKEEKMLKSYFQDAEASAADVSDDALEVAIQKGIRKGRHSKRSRVRYRGMALLAGALAVVILLVLSGSLQQTERMASGPYPPLKGHDFGEDITLNTANKHGMIQPVGKSETKGDYTITVDGILVGSQQLKVLYTLENRSDRKAIIRETKLTDLVGSELPVGTHYEGSNELEPGVHHLESNSIFSDAHSIPDQLSVQFRVARDSANARAGIPTEDEELLSIDLTLDMNTYRKYIRTIPLNKVIEIQGQKMTMREVVFSPAGIALKGNIDAGNTMKVSGLWEGYLESVKDGKTTRLTSTLGWGPGEDGEVTYFFSSNALDQPDSITLKAGGLYAVDPAKMSVVVDTEKRVVLNSPDNKMKFGQYTRKKEGHTLTLEYEEEEKMNYGSVQYDEEFIDGEGNKHKLDDSSRGVRSTTSSNSDTGWSKTTEYLYLIPKEYPQPLTFTLTSYPGVIEKDIEVPIPYNLNR
ncbi:protein of unknown function [Paenibacillus uliginis N3/975]|uniref:DUF5643 domain-containing protein n=1 Tax=Paenibacillus uliginis N3/975 TaxID=1313296 RepID=A0A1X7HSZ1_9BACL|nr:DUF4179 domain-containing protein [Paenibacillus uliginis]SMF91361.1 protein of unknown function [Paenibacillus uliginis N3/975]